MLQKARQDDASDPESLELVEVKPLQTDARNGSGIRLLVDGIEIAIEKGFDGTTLSEVLNLLKARKIRYRERSTVERGNSDLKDNYGARHVRVKGHWKVLCHLMFGVIAITVKQLFNMLE